MNYPWLRLYTEFAADPKIQILAFEDQRHYVMLLCLKGNGTLDADAPSEAYRERLIAKALGLDPVTAAEAKRRLLEGGLIELDWQPAKWDARQFMSDYSTLRVQKHREKLKGNVTETLLKRSETVIDTDTDTDTDKKQRRGDARGEPRATRSAATRLPKDFDLTSERSAYASAQGLDPLRVFENFLDYWTSASGAKARKHDWDATWRMWCRNETERSTQNGAARAPRKTRFAEITERLEAKINAH